MLPENLTEAMPARLQLSFRDLIYAVIGFSVLCFIGTHFGVRCLPLSVGLVICAVRLRFNHIVSQWNIASSIEFYLGLFCLVLSFILPVIQVMGTRLINGYEATQRSFVALEDLASISFKFDSEFFYTRLLVLTDVIYLMSIQLGNLSLALIPFFIQRIKKEQFHWYVYIIFLGAIVAWIFPMMMDAHLKPGYYLWSLSFIMIASPLVTTRRRFFVILVLAAIWCVKGFYIPLFSYFP